MGFWLIDKINNFDGGEARWLIDAAPDYPVYAAVLYLTMVFYLPGFLKKRNLTFDLKIPNAMWNLFMSCASSFGAYFTVTLIYDLVVNLQGFYATTCVMAVTPTNMKLTNFTRTVRGVDLERQQQLLLSDAKMALYHKDGADIWSRYYRGPNAFAIALFTYLKTPELLDTLFLILQGKPVVFLHWFHHISTAVHSWHSGYVLPPYALFFVALNYFVHALMYAYFFCVTLGYRKYVRWSAPIITLLQVSQMYLGIGVTSFAYFHYWLGPTHKGEWFYSFFYALFSGASFVWSQLGSLLFSREHRFLSLAEVPAFRMEDYFLGCDTDATNLRMSVMTYGAYCVLFVKLFNELYLSRGNNEHSLVVKRRTQQQQQQQQSAEKTQATSEEEAQKKYSVDVKGLGGVNG